MFIKLDFKRLKLFSLYTCSQTVFQNVIRNGTRNMAKSLGMLPISLMKFRIRTWTVRPRYSSKMQLRPIALSNYDWEMIKNRSICFQMFSLDFNVIGDRLQNRRRATRNYHQENMIPLLPRLIFDVTVLPF